MTAFRLRLWFVLLWIALAAACQQTTGEVGTPASEPGGQPAVEPTPTPPPPVPDKAPPPVALANAWEPDVRARLEKLIAEVGRGGPKWNEAQPPVVVFDFDNTCIRGDIGRAFFDYMVLERKFLFTEAVWEVLPADKRPSIRSAWDKLQAVAPERQAASVELQAFRKRMHQMYWALCTESDPERCYPWQVRFYAGYTPAQITEMAHSVMAKELARPVASEPIRAGADDPSPAITSSGIRTHAEIRELMERLNERGFELWVVSAGPQWVVQGATEGHFPVPAEHVIGMRTRLEGGKLTCEMDPPPTFRKGKVEAIEKFIGRKPVLVLGDSWADAEMMAYGELALLFDRGYADLHKQAIDSGWLIQPAFPTP